MEKYPVQVAADDYGNIIMLSKNNPEYGCVKLKQVKPIVKNGWVSFNIRVALLKGKTEDLKEMNFTKGQKLPGKIIVKESLVPFNIESPDRDLKIAGESGIICRINGEPIYRQTFYTENETDCDILISHDNSQEIKDVQSAQKAIELLNN